jgi:hypothetical protein
LQVWVFELFQFAQFGSKNNNFWNKAELFFLQGISHKILFKLLKLNSPIFSNLKVCLLLRINIILALVALEDPHHSQGV